MFKYEQTKNQEASRACWLLYSKAVSGLIRGFMYAAPSFWNACSNGRINEVRALAAVGVDLEERGGHDDCSPLFAAVYRRQHEVVEFLLEKKVDIHTTNKYGNTCLHVASASGFGSDLISKLLLANGANCNTKNDAGQTPAHYAAHSGQPVALETLLKHGADIMITDFKGYTVLHSATQRWLCHEEDDSDDYSWMIKDNHKIVQMLLDHCPDVWTTLSALKFETNDGHTAGQLAARSNNNGFRQDERLSDMLKQALATAEKTRMTALTAFAMGNHGRLGASSTVLSLGNDEIRLILDHV